MKHKNNWSHKTDYKTEREFDSLMNSTPKSKPVVDLSGRVFWGKKK